MIKDNVTTTESKTSSDHVASVAGAGSAGATAGETIHAVGSVTFRRPPMSKQGDEKPCGDS